MNKHLGLFAGAAAWIAAIAPAQAAVVYSNNFDTENSGRSLKNYQAFRGLTVTYPKVDLVHTGDGGGITCAGGAGGCVNLDGGEPGQLVSDLFTFRRGDVVTWTFSTSGSQKAFSPLDTTYYAFRFDQPTSGFFSFVSTTGLNVSGDTTALQNPFDPSTYDVGLAITAPYDYAFADVTFSFVPTSSGSFRFLFDAFNDDGTDFDGAGRVIDNVVLDISAVPEPASWSMLIVGFGMAGVAIRRRRERGVVRLA